MPERAALAEQLILEALRDEVARRPISGILLVGVEASATVRAANELLGSDRVALLHLDRASGAVGCGLGNAERFIGDESSHRSGYAVVAVNVEAAKSYRLLREIVGQTPSWLTADGIVLVAGPKKGGAEVAATVLRESFDSVDLLTYRQGQRIYRAERARETSHHQETLLASGTPHPPTPSPVRGRGGVEVGLLRHLGDSGADVSGLPLSRARERGSGGEGLLSLRGHTLQLLQDDRVFARGRLDPATRMLADVFEIPRGAAVLDLGCGGGILGVLAAVLEPTSQVTLVDSDPIAVRVSRQNASLNGAANVEVHLSDVLGAIPDRTFDVVLMNPPFHRGRRHDVALAERFIRDASRALRPGGSLYVVCNRFLRYERLLGQLLGSVREVTGNPQFKVLQARRPTIGRRTP